MEPACIQGDAVAPCRGRRQFAIREIARTESDRPDGELHARIRSFLAGRREDDWLWVWLLTEVGELDSAAGMLERMLRDGWLPNHQEMLLPIEDDPAFRALESHESAGRLKALLARNRRLAVERSERERRM